VNEFSVSTVSSTAFSNRLAERKELQCQGSRTINPAPPLSPS